MFRVLCIALSVACIGFGCGFARHSSARIDYLTTASQGEDLGTLIAPSTRPSERQCLLVLFPGIGDAAAQFEREGFVDDARTAAPECDLVLLEAPFAYYMTRMLENRVAIDVLAEARRWGYRNIWLVGVSLGGYGAVLTARAHPDLVDGVVLLAPVLGVPPRDEAAAATVKDAGGLHAWRGTPDPNPRHHFSEPLLVWDWLRSQVDHSAYGREDIRAPVHQVLAEALPAEHRFVAEGAHDWPTWRALWSQVLAARPWQNSPGATGVLAGLPSSRGSAL